MKQEAATPKPPADKRKMHRSPNYPYVPLGQAVEKAKIIWDREKKHPVQETVICQHWDYSLKSSGGRLTLAALTKYGLLEESPSTSGRELKLTERALTILVGEEPARKTALKEAALAPKIYKDLWAKFGPTLPSDDSLKSKLILGYNFNPGSVVGFIKDFRATISFAGLGEGDTVEASEDRIDSEEPEIAENNDNSNKNEQVIRPKPAKPVPANMLANYRIPLGLCEAELTFSGESLEAADFQALIDYVELFKAQYERKAKPSPAPLSQPSEPASDAGQKPSSDG